MKPQREGKSIDLKSNAPESSGACQASSVKGLNTLYHSRYLISVAQSRTWNSTLSTLDGMSKRPIVTIKKIKHLVQVRNKVRLSESCVPDRKESGQQQTTLNGG